MAIAGASPLEEVRSKANLAARAAKGALEEGRRDAYWADWWAGKARRAADAAEAIAARQVTVLVVADPDRDVREAMLPLWAECDRARTAARAAQVVAEWAKAIQPAVAVDLEK